MGEGGSGREQRTFFIVIVYTDNVDYVHHEPAKAIKNRRRRELRQKRASRTSKARGFDAKWDGNDVGV